MKNNTLERLLRVKDPAVFWRAFRQGFFAVYLFGVLAIVIYLWV